MACAYIYNHQHFVCLFLFSFFFFIFDFWNSFVLKLFVVARWHPYTPSQVYIAIKIGTIHLIRYSPFSLSLCCCVRLLWEKKMRTPFHQTNDRRNKYSPEHFCYARTHSRYCPSNSRLVCIWKIRKLYQTALYALHDLFDFLCVFNANDTPTVLTF